jgi:uncharacterized membrane protein YhaH (DUF805 family)
VPEAGREKRKEIPPSPLDPPSPDVSFPGSLPGRFPALVFIPISEITMWYYSLNGGQEGPFEEADFVHYFVTGALPMTTYVWREGMTDWLPVDQTELAAHLQPAAPEPEPEPVPVAVPVAVATAMPVAAAIPAASGQPRLILGGQPQTTATAQLKTGPQLKTAGPLKPATALAAAPAARQSALSNPYTSPRTAGLQTTPGLQLKSPMGWGQILWGFQGRIPRRTFWGATAAWFGAGALLLGLGSMLGTTGSESMLPLVFLGLLLLFLLAALWSSIAIQIKRWHDRGKPGTMVLVNFIPIAGGIWALVECGFLRGTTGPNQFGDDPT